MIPPRSEIAPLLENCRGEGGLVLPKSKLHNRVGDMSTRNLHVSVVTVVGVMFVGYTADIGSAMAAVVVICAASRHEASVQGQQVEELEERQNDHERLQGFLWSAHKISLQVLRHKTINHTPRKTRRYSSRRALTSVRNQTDHDITENCYQNSGGLENATGGYVKDKHSTSSVPLLQLADHGCSF